MLDAAREVLIAHGESPGSSMHGWRCEYPDRYGPCTCADDLVKDLMESLKLAAESDEHHTMDELYRYRMLYHAHAANLWARVGKYDVTRSVNHHDGQPCFGGGWFIVSAQLPTGQVSNHYRICDWDLFSDVPAVDVPATYDGHTPAQAADRLEAALR